ncbi:hypothetical protein Q8F55_001377 [Vanrija albida]|uniref:Proteasome inhibitor PI31 subunit n=1 Tax=Vanrija albida TaxID=181172 RepID=A0ABR3QGK7_9TREE
MSNPLDPVAVLALLQLLLPPSTTSPLPRPTDAVAALAHTIHAALGFRLAGAESATEASEADQAGPSGAEAEIDDAASETTTAVDPDEALPEAAPPGTALPRGWNDRGEDAYSFEYRHPQSAMTFRVRVGRMGGRVQIDAMAEDGAPHTLSLVLADIVNASAFPIPSAATGGRVATARDATSLGFTSLDRVRGFIEQYNRDIIGRLIPGLAKDGYRAPPVAPAPPAQQPGAPRRPGAGQPEPARPNPLIDPLADVPRVGGIPGPSIGHRDLDPLGPLRGPGGLGSEAGGGMLVDFNHPLFDGRRPRDPDRDGPGGSINPPGARWDPVGPGAGGPRFPGPGGNPLGGVGRTDPDWGDELPPPGEFGPDLGHLGGPRFPGGPRGGRGGFGGGFGGPGGFGGGRGGFGGGGGGFGGGFGGGGGGMFM